MKSAKYILPVAVVTVFGFSMCDYVTDPHDVDSAVSTFDTTKRVALVEEWTGHTCIACPAAARDIDTLESIYGQAFIAISIHDDYFAEPCPSPHPTPNCATGHPGAFSEDFRCPTGLSYTAAHPAGPTSPPQGMVNRLGMQSGTEIKTRGYWPGLVDSLVHEQACASMHVTPSFNSGNRQVSVTVNGTWLQAYTGTINIAIMLTESGMVGWQTDGTMCDSAFEFTNVLRECLNTPGSITGTQLSTGTTGPGTTYSYTLPGTYTLPANFNENNCNIIALIYDTTTGEVLQAGDAQLQ
jgi:hypothetical protein